MKLREPPLEEEAGTARMSMTEAGLTAELDLVAIANFRWSLHFLATTCPILEDIDIWATSFPAPANDPLSIDYCEITLIGEDFSTDDLDAFGKPLLHRDKRVDFFVNRAQAIQAYLTLEKLIGATVGQQVTLFGGLVIKIITPEIDKV